MNIETSAGRIIAEDTQRSVEAIDRTVMSLANLCASIVEVSNASHLPITTGQAVLFDIGESLTKAIGTRASVGQVTRELLKLKKNSNLDTVAVGCPPDYKPMANVTGPVTASEPA